MNIKGIMLIMSFLVVTVAILSGGIERTSKPHGGTAKSGIVTNDDTGEDDGCDPDDGDGDE